MIRSGRDFNDEEMKEMLKEGDYEKNGGITFTEFFSIIKGDYKEDSIVLNDDNKNDFNESLDSIGSCDDNFRKTKQRNSNAGMKKSKFFLNVKEGIVIK